MKLILKVLLLTAQITLTNNLIAFSTEIKDRNEYLFDTRGDDGDIYLNRLSLHKKLDPPDIETSLFAETQWNIETSEWEKLLFGLEARKLLWKYLCLSQSIQLVSGEILDYVNFEVSSNSIDTTTKIGLHLPLIKNFSFLACEEYSFNLEEGRDEYCESIAEISYNHKDYLSIGIGWRHTDRIHNFDTDYVSSSLMLRF
jgi:hypothetical protein